MLNIILAAAAYAVLGAVVSMIASFATGGRADAMRTATRWPFVVAIYVVGSVALFGVNVALFVADKYDDAKALFRRTFRKEAA